MMGEYRHTLDAKNRVLLPAYLREELGDEFIITRGLDGCLNLYSPAEWERFSRKFRELPQSMPNVRACIRFFFGGAKLLECDRQGRFLIPAGLCEYAELTKDVMLVGVENHAEIWNRQKWQAYNGEITPLADEIAKTLREWGV